ncbi:MAG: hypothetical protein ACREDL_00895 [Bradyrhizobium sp.]
MKLAAHLASSIKGNPLAWVLFVALLISGYGNYETGRHLTAVCENIGDMMAEPPLNAPRSAMAAWQRREADQVDDICGSRLLEPAPENP